MNSFFIFIQKASLNKWQDMAFEISFILYMITQIIAYDITTVSAISQCYIAMMWYCMGHRIVISCAMYKPCIQRYNILCNKFNIACYIACDAISYAMRYHYDFALLGPAGPACTVQVWFPAAPSHSLATVAVVRCPQYPPLQVHLLKNQWRSDFA